MAKKIVIAGGGAAAIELILALRELAGERVDIELLAPEPAFSYRPLAVGTPFGLGEAPRFDLRQLARDRRVDLRSGALTAVEPDARLAVRDEGRRLPYDALVVAVGATPRPALDGALTFSSESGAGERLEQLLEDLGRGVESVAFAVPAQATWTLPLYELALMTAAYVRARQLDTKLTLVTPEDAPLALFGARATAAVRNLLDERGISLRTGAHPVSIEEGRLTVAPGKPVPADRVVCLPVLEGPRIPGLPHDADGFLPVDRHGRVEGAEAVFAAGDATNFPVKQGGLATQQADAVAEWLAADVGVSLSPAPFRPVLRGLLLTGGPPAYLRGKPGGGGGEVASEAAVEPLWWPPSKIAGRYLSRYLASLSASQPPTPEGIRIEIDDLEPLLRPRS